LKASHTRIITSVEGAMVTHTNTSMNANTCISILTCESEANIPLV